MWNELHNSHWLYLFSYNKDDNIAEKASGFISLFSLSLYKLHLNCNKCSTDSTSEAKPVNPIYNLSEIGNTYEKCIMN